jgi:hypothetical protein
MLYCGGIGGITAKHFGQLAVQIGKAKAHIPLPLARGAVANAIGDMGQARARHIDHAPTKVAKARIDSQNPHLPAFAQTYFTFYRNSTKREHPPSLKFLGPLGARIMQHVQHTTSGK